MVSAGWIHVVVTMTQRNAGKPSMPVFVGWRRREIHDDLLQYVQRPPGQRVIGKGEAIF